MFAESYVRLSACVSKGTRRGGTNFSQIQEYRVPPRFASGRVLLDFDGGDAFELLGDRGRVILRNVLLQGLGSTVDQVLGFLQAKSGDFAYSLDGIDLIRAGILQDDGEFGLLFSRSRRCRTAACCRGCCNCRCCRNAKALLELLDQSRGLEEAAAND